MPVLEESPDATLVAACLSGDRAAYGLVVARYQRLLCSVAYSSLGSVSDSEDLAQEAFIEGWRKLGTLQDPAKLRPWLCGILRFKISHRLRRAARQPESRADSIDETHATDLIAPDEPVEAQAIRKEEQALLWQALEHVPPLYREPLVLFYREHQSIEHVAGALDLSEDAVKQRLLRGRKLLQEQMISFVETALVRSTPGRVFTLSVLAALPELATPAKAAMLGAAAQGSGLAKTTTLAAFVASASGLVSAVMALRASLDQARTPRERRANVKATLAAVLGVFGLLGVLFVLTRAALHWWDQRLVLAVIAQGFGITIVVVGTIMFFVLFRKMRELRTSERRLHPECFRDERDRSGSSVGVLRSRASLFGVPLVHFRFAAPEVGDRPVFGWIAGGDRAYGLLFAWGGFAVAPISCGAFSVGLITAGCIGVGVVSLGTFAVGVLALGCVAFGVNTFAWLSALGWETAQSGGFAIARLAAEGPIAFARYANDPMARQLLMDPHAERNQMIFFLTISLLTLLPITYYAREVRRRMGRKS